MLAFSGGVAPLAAVRRPRRGGCVAGGGAVGMGLGAGGGDDDDSRSRVDDRAVQRSAAPRWHHSR
eukprot:6926930-Alexandrium_andersonii.AAC.1